MSDAPTGDNIVQLFKTYEQMHADECAIYKEHYDAWHAAYHRWDLVKAALADDPPAELAKLAAGDGELALAKSDAARLKTTCCYPDVAADAELAKKLRALEEKNAERLFGLSALAKRSMRFASAHGRRN
jgi:hypothetical protein